jgi:hypothetical protein
MTPVQLFVSIYVMSLSTYGEKRGRVGGKHGYLTSNCEQKNIPEAQLLTFLMLLVLYLINFLRSGRKKPWFLIQNDDDDDGARTQNYWKYLIKKAPNICPLTVKVTKKMFKRIVSLNTQGLWRNFPKYSLWLIM